MVMVLGYLVLAAQNLVADRVKDGALENVINTCGPNESFQECVSSSCAELTCDSPEPTDECTRDCETGCFCSSHFYRNSRRECVTLDQCS